MLDLKKQRDTLQSKANKTPEDKAARETVFSIGYDFQAGNGTAGTGSDNGNVWNIYNYRDRTRDQSFNYDALNRLISAQNAGTDCTAATVNGKTEYWGNTYGYDPWGNLIDKTITKCGAETFHPGAASVQNQLTGYGYDAAGNMTSDPTDSVSSTYDAENRIASASTPQGLFTYTYDADGNRVEKSGGGTGTLYWYMTPGIIGESDLSGVMKSEYVFVNGERVARRDFDPTTGTPTGVFYYFSDHLKTASIVTDSAGNIKSESDYYPWGGELQFVNNDSNHYKFTGKERDTESGLDYFGARYYSNGLGRFITPDWAAKAVDVPYAEFSDPQSLNLYSYVRNVPTVKADPDGHCPNCVLALGGAVIGAAINVGVTYFTKPNATAKDYAAAAVSGAVTGAVAGFTGGASLGVQVVANATANVVAGAAERSIESGHVEVGKASDVLKDGAIGAAGPVLEHLGTKAVQAIAGKTSKELAERASESSLGERHSSSLHRQAKAAERAEDEGAKAGATVAKGIEVTHRANENKNEKKER